MGVSRHAPLTRIRHSTDTYARPAEEFAVGVATVFRYVREAVDLLATAVPTLSAGLCRLAHNGHQLGIVHGTVVRIDRLGGNLDRLCYSASTTITASACRGWLTRVEATWCGSATGRPDRSTI